jgi:hypothetical protein
METISVNKYIQENNGTCPGDPNAKSVFPKIDLPDRLKWYSVCSSQRWPAVQQSVSFPK